MEEIYTTQDHTPLEIIGFVSTFGELVAEIKEAGEKGKFIGIVVDVETEEDKKELEESKKEEKKHQNILSRMQEQLKNITHESTPTVEIKMLHFKTDRHFRIVAYKSNNKTYCNFGRDKELHEDDYNLIKQEIIQKFNLALLNCARQT